MLTLIFLANDLYNCSYPVPEAVIANSLAIAINFVRYCNFILSHVFPSVDSISFLTARPPVLRFHTLTTPLAAM